MTMYELLKNRKFLLVSNLLLEKNDEIIQLLTDLVQIG
jgi:hypothetical protein